MRSAFYWFSKFCHSQCLSHFAASFIDAQAEASTVKSCDTDEFNFNHRSGWKKKVKRPKTQSHAERILHFWVTPKVCLLQGVYTLMQSDTPAMASWFACLCVSVCKALPRRWHIKLSSWLQLFKLPLCVEFRFSWVALDLELIRLLSFDKPFSHEVKQGYPLNLSI